MIRIADVLLLVTCCRFAAVLHVCCQAVESLIACGCAALAPVFQFSNVYLVTEHIGTLLADEALQQECLRFVCRGGSTGSGGGGSVGGGGSTVGGGGGIGGPAALSSSVPPQQRTNAASIPPTDADPPVSAVSPPAPTASPASLLPPPSRSTPNIQTLFSLYCEYVPQLPLMTVTDFCERHYREQLHAVDIRRFIQFGCLRGLLRKVMLCVPGACEETRGAHVRTPYALHAGRFFIRVLTLCDAAMPLLPMLQANTHPMRDAAAAAENANDDAGGGGGGGGGGAGRGSDGGSGGGVLSRVPQAMLTGQHTTDEICCEYGLSERHLRNLLESDAYCITFRR